MPTIETRNLTGAALDWAVAHASGTPDDGNGLPYYSIDWALGGPIIEREGVELVPDKHGGWTTALRGGDEDTCANGPTPLIAAMRCYVASKLGHEIESENFYA